MTIEDKNVFDAVLNQTFKHIFRNGNHRFKADINRHRRAVIVCRGAEWHTRYHNGAGQPLCCPAGNGFRHKQIRTERKVRSVALAAAENCNGAVNPALIKQIFQLFGSEFIQIDFFHYDLPVAGEVAFAASSGCNIR